jgi:aspartyl-tRNA(Asn)/glutamyl-tRNA(Gln) amidotransferase subunit C
MAETLSRADVERIAALARLELTPDEVTLFAGQLTAILAYADQVQQVDTSGSPAVASATVGPPTVLSAEASAEAEALAEVDLPTVLSAEASAEAEALAKVGRDDLPAPSLDRDLALSQAPAADAAAGIFKVPRVLGS